MYDKSVFKNVFTHTIIIILIAYYFAHFHKDEEYFVFTIHYIIAMCTIQNDQNWFNSAGLSRYILVEKLTTHLINFYYFIPYFYILLYHINPTWFVLIWIILLYVYKSDPVVLYFMRSIWSNL